MSSWLRRALGDERGRVLVTDEHGYRLEVTDRQLDVGEFDELSARGRAALRRGDAEDAADLLRGALALWRGNPLSDVPPTELVTTAAERLTGRWLDTWESTVDAELACGSGLRAGRRADPAGRAAPVAGAARGGS